MNPRRVGRLAGMGLRVWLPRPAAPGGAAAPASGLERIGGGPGAPFAALVVGAADFTPGADHPEGALLQRVLASLEVPPAQFAILRCSDPAGIDGAAVARATVPAPTLLLAFAGRPLPGLPDAVLLPTLAEMLASRAAKRRAWERLRPLVGTLRP